MSTSKLFGIVMMFCACIIKVQAQGYLPPKGCVPDAKTAVRIAVAVWSPIYGERQIQFEKPFRASLTRGIWTVSGSLPALHGHLGVEGGTAMVQISKRDGRILFVMHGK